MDMQLFTSLLLFLSFILLLINLWKKTKPPQKYQNLPPSPPMLPIIGNLHHLAGRLSHEALQKVSQKYGSVARLQLGEVSMVVISSPEASKEVMKVQDPAFADRPASVALKAFFYDYSNIAFSAYGEYWRQIRKICMTEMLSAKNVRSFGHIRQDEITRLVKSLQSSPGKVVNFTEEICELTCTVTCRATFGKVMNGRATLTAMLKKIPIGGFQFADFFPSFPVLHLLSWNVYKLNMMRRKVDAILDVIVEEHRHKRSGEYDGEDILDVLLRMQRNKELQYPISNNNIKAVIFDMFTGGTETSTTTIDWAMAELMRNPHVMAKLQSEIRGVLKGKESVEENDVQGLKYLKLVIKETLRLHPAFPLIPRACRGEECKVLGYTIPNKTKLMINVWALGRDPDLWKDPESFQPERFDNVSTDFMGNYFEYIPFGSGRRICPGLNFGLANVELPLAQLLYHFDWKLPKGMNPADVDMTANEGITVGLKNPLLLVSTTYNPSN